MRVVPRGVSRVATTRTVSAVIASSRPSAAITRPSALLTTLLVTTTTSPSARPADPSGHREGAVPLRAHLRDAARLVEGGHEQDVRSAQQAMLAQSQLAMSPQLIGAPLAAAPRPAPSAPAGSAP